MSGLQSLTANYTDSEEEGVDEGSQNGSPDYGRTSGPPSVVDRFREAAESRGNTPASTSSKHSETSRSARSTPVKKPTRLVSYIDPDEEEDADRTINEDEETAEAPVDKVEKDSPKEDKNSEPVPMDLDSESESIKKDEDDEVEEEGSTHDKEDAIVKGIAVDAWTEGGKLPPEPPGLCSPSLQEKINKLYQKKVTHNYDMNAVIQNKKAFRNPSIYDKLIQFCGIDEHGTNFPKELYDGHLFGKESYYDELAKVQKAEMDRREKAKVGKATDVGSASAGIKTVDETKRRSKWDQAPVISAAVASSSTAKTIPAFGLLSRKH